MVLEEEVSRNTMKKKTKIIIAAVAVIVLAAIAAGGFFLVNQKLSKTEYEEQMKTAEKYLSSGDDEKAILAYEKAIAASPKESEAYEKLADIYIKNDNLNKAKYYINLGIKKASNTGKLQFMLVKYIDGSGTTENKATKKEEEALEEENSEEISVQKVQGTVVNAVTGEGVADANVSATLVESKNKADKKQSENAKDQVLSDRTKANGRYELKLASGKYQITIQIDGFVQESFEVEVADKELQNQNFTISPELKAGEIRVVLEWGASPNDLDVYAFKNSLTDFNNAPIYYAHKGSTSSGATLDVDDRNGYGPETITITDTASTWYIGVHNFAGNSLNELSASSATIKVYMAGTEPKVYSVPQGSGYLWTVCKISGGNITDINKIDENDFVE